MAGIKKILAATDFSERAARASRRAALLCAELKAGPLELLTVKEAGLPQTLAQVLHNTQAQAETVLVQRAERELQLVCDLLRDNYCIACVKSVRFGSPEREIVAAVKALPADLVVIGAHGGNFFSDLFLGNTADRLVHMTTTPLLIVKQEPKQAYRNILVPVDFSEDSRLAARMALKIAPAANIVFLHAFDVWYEGHMRYAGVSQELIDEYRMNAAENARQELNRFVASLNADGRMLTRVLVFGLPGPQIRDHADKMQTDLIVMGKHGRSRMEELMLGSATRHTLEQTACDVLVMPAPPPAIGATGP